ncbi:MAG: hypothetical protein ACRDKI_10225 [Solirubrobacterales bacterium]
MKSPIKIRKKGGAPAAAAHPQTAATATFAPPAAYGVPTNAIPAAVTNGNGNGAAPVTMPQAAAPAIAPAVAGQAANAETLDLERRRDQLAARVAELQWDLGGLAYEMAVRNRMRPEVLVKRAAALQSADAELGEIERILRMERTGVAALCLTCGAPHSSGAVFCWQCGNTLLEQVPGATIAAPKPLVPPASPPPPVAS